MCKISFEVKVSLRLEFGGISRSEAINQIHSPESEQILKAARHSLALEEFFILQLNVAYRKFRHKNLEGCIHAGSGKLISPFLASLPL